MILPAVALARPAARSADGVLVPERQCPCPGELWRYADVRVIVTGVSQGFVTYSEEQSRGSGMTREAMPIFLEVFYRTNGSAEALRC